MMPSFTVPPEPHRFFNSLLNSSKPEGSKGTPEINVTPLPFLPFVSRAYPDSSAFARNGFLFSASTAGHSFAAIGAHSALLSGIDNRVGVGFAIFHFLSPFIARIAPLQVFGTYGFQIKRFRPAGPGCHGIYQPFSCTGTAGIVRMYP
jgi:hypothetical protein